MKLFCHHCGDPFEAKCPDCGETDEIVRFDEGEMTVAELTELSKAVEDGLREGLYEEPNPEGASHE